MWADALYLRDPIAAGCVPRHPAAAIALALVYGKYDVAIELAAFCVKCDVYSDSDGRRLLPLLHRLAAGPTARRYTVRLARWAQRLADRWHGAHWARYETWRF